MRQGRRRQRGGVHYLVDDANLVSAFLGLVAEIVLFELVADLYSALDVCAIGGGEVG